MPRGGPTWLDTFGCQRDRCQQPCAHHSGCVPALTLCIYFLLLFFECPRPTPAQLVPAG